MRCWQDLKVMEIYKGLVDMEPKPMFLIKVIFLMNLCGKMKIDGNN